MSADEKWRTDPDAQLAMLSQHFQKAEGHIANVTNEPEYLDKTRLARVAMQILEKSEFSELRNDAAHWSAQQHVQAFDAVRTILKNLSMFKAEGAAIAEQYMQAAAKDAVNGTAENVERFKTTEFPVSIPNMAVDTTIEGGALLDPAKHVSHTKKSGPIIPLGNDQVSRAASQSERPTKLGI